MAKKKVAINGFGRIGRLFFRAAVVDEVFNKNFEIVALNDITDAKTLAHLLKYDSVHGRLDANISASETTLCFKGKEIAVYSQKDLLKLPWSSLDVDYVIESTGRYSDRNSASQHLVAGAKKVIISAPSKTADAVLIPGVNLEKYNSAKHDVISMASCTTNSIAPLLKVLCDEFGIKNGFLSTVHAYTNDQRLQDLPHSDLRRSRAAPLSIIPTSTGAASAIGQVIPELQGKMDGIAMRVPVACGSISDLSLILSRETTREEVNRVVKKACDGKLKSILKYTEEEIVSADVIDDDCTGIFDSGLTSVLNGKGDFLKVYSWYDNEWGYSAKLVDLLKYIYLTKQNTAAIGRG
ncbi:MAG: type I glyceraldehyde-3-phosphate dehydrogenase [Candidatus Micrarchaeota archaeon]